jgi:hypothetical protein
MENENPDTPNNSYDFDDEMTRRLQERDEAREDDLAGAREATSLRRNRTAGASSHSAGDIRPGSDATPLAIRAKLTQVKR